MMQKEKERIVNTLESCMKLEKAIRQLPKQRAAAPEVEQDEFAHISPSMS